MDAHFLDKVFDLLSQEYVLVERNREDNSIENVIENIIKYYESLIDSMPGNVYWLDNNLRAVGCNQNVLDMFGLKSKSEFKGLSFEEMGRLGKWTAQATKSFEYDTREVIDSGKPKFGIEEPPIPHQDGRLIYFLTSRVPIFGQNKKVIGVIGISVDITERKFAEEQLRIAKEKAEEANRAKTEFMEMMTHELRTPLTVILGNLHNLLQHPKDSIENHLQTFQYMKISGELLLSHINDILDYAQMRKGQFNLHPEQFDLENIIQASMALLSANAKSKNIKLILDYPQELPHSFFADKDRISQILFNIVGNAIKFTKKGEVKVKVECLALFKDKAQMKISISDNGCGIPSDKLQTIFEKFEQLNTGEQKKGTGLGLAIVKEIINKFKGQIAVESELGNGSTFHIVLPLNFKASSKEKKALEKSLQFDEVKSHVPKKKSKQSRHVLIVEDNAINQTVIEDMLKNLGCETKTAATAKQALALIEQHDFDLILMDINLPDSNGYDLTQLIRKKSDNQPIIALTANASEAMANRCKESGMNGMLGKPINPDHLARTLRRWLG